VHRPDGTHLVHLALEYADLEEPFLVRAPFAFRMPAAAIDIGPLFHGLTLGTAILFRRHARANGMCALLAFFGVHASLP
jgi:hypothetical protein